MSVNVENGKGDISEKAMTIDRLESDTGGQYADGHTVVDEMFFDFGDFGTAKK